MTHWLASWKRRAHQLKIELYALYLAYRDPRVPLYARVFAACVVGYAFSPIDLIPDFIPILGYLDDLVIIPVGIVVALKMIPAVVMLDYRLRAQEVIKQGKPVNRTAAVIIVILWLLFAAICLAVIVRLIRS
jgi:uncharacterized membrane protein YkvA (DUF1232 family)